MDYYADYSLDNSADYSGEYTSHSVDYSAYLQATTPWTPPAITIPPTIPAAMDYSADSRRLPLVPPTMDGPFRRLFRRMDPSGNGQFADYSGEYTSYSVAIPPTIPANGPPLAMDNSADIPANTPAITS